ncbi:MAG TPA: peptidoglycan DD-metalloendopeptidase family protein [Polyangiaceae bacterium]|nr:peptidoglycan DD-metalloendopeptidase family protein [Polyangiaceae bacterium]
MKRGIAVIVLLAGPALSAPSGDAADRAAREGAMPATANDVENVLERVDTDEKRLGERLSALAGESARLHALLLLRGRSYVKMARAGLLPIGGGLDAFVDHASRLERLRRSLSRDLSREEEIAEERVALTKRRAVLGDRKALLETEHAALERSHGAILAAQEREAAFRQAFTGSREPTPHTAVYGSGFGPADPYEASQGFAALKGRLPFPIEGRTEVRPLRLPGAEGPGLQLMTAPGAAVRAVFRGRVAFADEYAEYGRAVIVDHGSGYYTVSGNLGTIDVKVGEELAAGDKIGTVGEGAKGAALYFELRRGTMTVNPAPWFGI